MGGAGGEQLGSVRADPLHDLVQLGAHAIACVRARSLLISLLLYLVSSLAPCLVRRDRERADAAVRVRARSPLEGSRPSRWWGRDSGLGTMQVPWVARVASRLRFCRVVLRDAVEDLFIFRGYVSRALNCRENFKRCCKCIGVEVVHAWEGSERVGAFSIARYDEIYLVR